MLCDDVPVVVCELLVSVHLLNAESSDPETDMRFRDYSVGIPSFSLHVNLFAALLDYVEGTAESTSQTAREAVIRQEEGEATTAATVAAVPIKSEDVIEHEVDQRQEQQQQQQQQRQLAYVASEEIGKESVGVLKAGQPEMENGAIVESTGGAVAIAVAAAAGDHVEDPNAIYTLHQLGYHAASIIRR